MSLLARLERITSQMSGKKPSLYVEGLDGTLRLPVPITSSGLSFLDQLKRQQHRAPTQL